MTIGQVIQAIRKEKGYTQRQLAEKCGMATGTIQQYELGKREPRLAQLQKIADAMGVMPTRFYLAMRDEHKVMIQNKYFKGADLSKMTDEQICETLESNIRNEKELMEFQKDMQLIDGIIEKAQRDVEERGIRVIAGVFTKLNILGKNELLKHTLKLFEDPRYTQKEEDPPDKKE